MATDERDVRAGDDGDVGEDRVVSDDEAVSDDEEATEKNEAGEDGETGGHLEAIDDGCGCAEVWELLSDERE